MFNKFIFLLNVWLIFIYFFKRLRIAKKVKNIQNHNFCLIITKKLKIDLLSEFSPPASTSWPHAATHSLTIRWIVIRLIIWYLRVIVLIHIRLLCIRIVWLIIDWIIIRRRQRIIYRWVHVRLSIRVSHLLGRNLLLNS